MSTETVNGGAKKKEDLESLRADITALRADMKELLSDVGDVAGSYAESGKKSGKAAADKLAAKGKDGLRQAETTIQDHPLASLGLAFALGALFGVTKRK